MILRTEAEIRAAGAVAVAGWSPTPRQVDAIAALFAPVLDIAYGPLTLTDESTEFEQELQTAA